MNPLNLFRTERQKQLADQERKRSWAAAAVHRHLEHPSMHRTRSLWLHPNASKPLLAVVNIPRWPLPKNDPATVRFLDMNKLAQGRSQWLRQQPNLACPSTATNPEDACIFATPQAPHLKILCLTPKGWSDCYRRLTSTQDHGLAAPILRTLTSVLQSHSLTLPDLILTSPQNLSLPPETKRQNSGEHQ